MSSEDIVAFSYRVTGKVQGVFFRKYTKKKADSLNLVGTVQNNSDGSVSGVVQGPHWEVDAFVKYLYKGSPKAVVESVNVKPCDALHATTFDVLR